MSEAVFHPEKSQEGFLEVSNSDLTTDSRLVGGRTLSRGQNDVRACLSQKYLAAKNVLCSLGEVEPSLIGVTSKYPPISLLFEG